MRRTVPLLITAIGGIVLIVAFFIPATESWGEVAAIWFDILAAIAFVLGGANLVKIHLKKISDQAAGWGYSGVTLISFFVMLTVGLVKWGAPPAPNQEFYGQSFAQLAVAEFPLVYSVEGSLPENADPRTLPPAVRRQVTVDPSAGTISFRGWMTPRQLEQLDAFHDDLQWRCTAERLFDEAQPPPPLRGRVQYLPDHHVLSFAGHMADDQRQELDALSDAAPWRAAIERLYEVSQREVAVTADTLPPLVDLARVNPALAYDAQTDRLSIRGPMSRGQRDQLVGAFPLARPLTPADREALFSEIVALGPLTPEQREEGEHELAALWTVEQLHVAIDLAGAPVEVPKTACEMLAEREAGETDIQPTRMVGEEQTLNEEQVDALERFAASDMTIDQLVAELRDAGPLSAPQEGALRGFLAQAPTIGERNRRLAVALLEEGPLNEAQQDFLFADIRQQAAWTTEVDRLFLAAHVVKYPWSGEYRSEGGPFWWLYEFAFKPLTATMFSLLAFYVASAAFRAFRAKNIEATLLLGTAFLILLGRTFAGVMLTEWLPEQLSFLRIENLTIFIMSVFNTAGNRAIMIGIALGIASTSLKVLLGIDRSYLGSGD